MPSPGIRKMGLLAPLLAALLGLAVLHAQQTDPNSASPALLIYGPPKPKLSAASGD